MPQAAAAAPAATLSPNASAQPSATVKGLAGWVEVFRAGSHVDSKARPISFSNADLDQMVANHALGAAPAVLGHPQHNDPAYAWVGGLKREGGSLFAKFIDVHPAFEAGIKSGAYRNRSVAVVPDPAHGWRVQHVGWLGAKPPAIDGLASVAFAAADADVHEFAAPGSSLVWAVESLARLMRGLREQLIEKDGIEAADAVLPQWQIDSANEAASAARNEFQEADAMAERTLFNKEEGSMTTFTQEQLDAAKDEARKEADTAARSEFAASQTELVKLRSERQAERIGAQIAGWKADGKVLPAEERGLAEFMTSLDGLEAPFTFSASDGKPAEQTPAQFFATFMSGRKALVKLGLRTDDEDPKQAVNLQDPRAIVAAAREFQASEAKAGRVITVEGAVAHITRDVG